MLPASHRLRQFRDFQRVYRTGRSQHSAFFRMYVVKNDLLHTRFGIVIPNKLIKSAVDRNKKKRQIRAALRVLLPQVKPGFDVVLSAQDGLKNADYAEMLADLVSTLTKAAVL